MIRLAGLPFEVGPEDRLNPAERDVLALAGGETPAFGTGPAFRLALANSPPWTSDDGALFPEGAPAVIGWHRGLVRVSHATFVAELDPSAGRGALYRRGPESGALEITLRVALTCRLPLAGGLPLHAAGLVMNGRGVVFFGPSGAGKSTLAASSPHPVLSDELVVVLAAPRFAVAAAGIWGSLGRGTAVPGFHPLHALVELDKGPGFSLERLPVGPALRRLLGVTLIPAGPPLWSKALALLTRLVRDVPVYRMAWSPAEPPWPALARALNR